MISIINKTKSCLLRRNSFIPLNVKTSSNYQHTDAQLNKVEECNTRTNQISEQFKKEKNKFNREEFVKKANYRFLYPEFLPDPNMSRRHYLREKLERADMMARRRQIEIPEFYAGCIMAVSVSDPYSPGATNRFVGICILREEHGLRTNFVLRNVVDHQGIEIKYDMYNPTIQKIEVLRLEKRLDVHLLYLRDALPEYSTVPFDMEVEPYSETDKVPVNPLKVQMKPLPWYARWERCNLEGMMPYDHLLDEETNKLALIRGEKAELVYEKYDLMKEYRKLIPEEDQKGIWDEVHDHHLEVQDIRRKDRKKKLISKNKDK